MFGHAGYGAGRQPAHARDSRVRGKIEHDDEGTRMQELRLVAVSEDGTYLVLATAGRGTRFTLPVDDRLRAAVRGNFSRLGQYEIEVESPLRPKEIQARIRAGETAEEIAATAGIPVERVRWFEGPVLQEREYLAQQAQRVAVRLPGENTPGPTLGDLVAERLTRRGVPADEIDWDSCKRDDNLWRVKLGYVWNGHTRHAEWLFDPRRRHITPNDDEAMRLSATEYVEPPREDNTTVRPFVPRLARGLTPVPPLPGAPFSVRQEFPGRAEPEHEFVPTRQEAPFRQEPSTRVEAEYQEYEEYEEPASPHSPASFRTTPAPAPPVQTPTEPPRSSAPAGAEPGAPMPAATVAGVATASAKEPPVETVPVQAVKPVLAVPEVTAMRQSAPDAATPTTAVPSTHMRIADVTTGPEPSAAPAAPEAVRAMPEAVRATVTAVGQNTAAVLETDAARAVDTPDAARATEPAAALAKKPDTEDDDVALSGRPGTVGGKPEAAVDSEAEPAIKTDPTAEAAVVGTTGVADPEPVEETVTVPAARMSDEAGAQRAAPTPTAERATAAARSAATDAPTPTTAPTAVAEDVPPGAMVAAPDTEAAPEASGGVPDGAKEIAKSPGKDVKPEPPPQPTPKPAPTRPRKSRGRRASVPTWDEIMFGARKQD